ncbi:hypothetical protein [uncultured Tateyamaria sp.]|uniref:hypothetical protein n=1 Tax=uncultured Tateyamaria sp. TaxID=455651 RepID=UPI00260BBA62|nr:hypothetical protein [uncultured Tateyamaria sp.]
MTYQNLDHHADILVLPNRVRLASSLFPILLGAVLFDHAANGWQYPVFLLAASLAVFLPHGHTSPGVAGDTSGGRHV